MRQEQWRLLILSWNFKLNLHRSFWFIILVILLLADSNNGLITLYENENGRGDSIDVSLDTEVCNLFPRGWSENVKSIDLSTEPCIELFGNNICEGNSIRVQVQGRYSIRNMNGLIEDGSSVQAVQRCSSQHGSSQSSSWGSRHGQQHRQFYRHQKKSSNSISTVTLYEFAQREGNKITLRVEDCTMVPPGLNNNIASIDTHNHCVRLYDDDDCEGESVQIQPFDPASLNLHFWDFIDKTSSIGPCRQFQLDGLQMNNAYRARHGASSLVLNETLNIQAEQDAANLIAQPELSPQNSYTSGELIFVTTIPPLFSSGRNTETLKSQIVSDAINTWYSEIGRYNTSDPIPSPFTQLIWNSSNQLGIGFGSSGRRVIVMAKYSPVGNIEGHFLENVFV